MFNTSGDHMPNLQSEKILLRCHAIFQAIGYAAEQFLRTTDLHYNIKELLKRLGRATEVQRVALFANSSIPDGSLGMSVYALWTVPDYELHIDDLTLDQTSYDANGLTRWKETLEQGYSIYGNIYTFPEREQYMLKRLQICSVMVAPIFIGQKWWGFLRFDACCTDRDWSFEERETIKIATGIIGGAMQRYDVQETIHKGEAELRKLYRAIECSPDSITITDTDGMIEFVNPKFTHITGYSYAEAVGQKMGLFISNTSSNVYQDLWQTITEGKEWEGVFLNKRKDGQTYWQHSSISPIANAHGIISYFVVVSQDITKQVEIEEELRQARDSAEKAALAKSEFLAHMSHEIRNPLSAILGMARLLLNTPINSMQQDFLQTILISSNALLDVVNDILDFSKIEVGKLRLRKQPFDLHQCVEETVDLFAVKADEKHIHLLYSIDERIPPIVIGDRHRFNQILTNLVSNGIKFTDQGEVVISLTSEDVVQSASSALVHLKVCDTGIGIPQEALGQLFQSFSQVEMPEGRQYGGSGLGLAISKHIAEMMGGTMWVESVFRKGSTFHATIQFELASAEHQEYTKEEHHLWLLHEQPLLSGKRVLILDDHMTSQALLTRLVQYWQMTTEVTSSCLQALEWLESEQTFDMMMINLFAVEIDAFEVVKQIRALPKNEDLPLVLGVSVSTFAQVGGSVKDEGVVLLSRPIKPAHLYSHVIKILTNQTFEPTISPVSVQNNAQIIEERSLNILLADDDFANQKVSVLLLNNMGHQVDTVKDGLEVIELLKHKKYDVIFMDVQMPRMNGIKTTQHIRQIWQHDNIPWIIALTGRAGDDDREQLLSIGMNDYLSKPIDDRELASALQRVPKEKRASAPSVGLVLPVTRPTNGPLSLVSEPIDANTLHHFMAMTGRGGKKGTYEMLGVFLNDMMFRDAAMQEALEHQDLESIHVAAHSLKSLSGQIGATTLSKISDSIATLSQQDWVSFPLDELVVLVSAAKQEFHRVREIIHKKMEEIAMFL